MCYKFDKNRLNRCTLDETALKSVRILENRHFKDVVSQTKCFWSPYMNIYIGATAFYVTLVTCHRPLFECGGDCHDHFLKCNLKILKHGLRRFHNIVRK